MSAADRAREESARQLVYLAVMAIGIPLLIWWERKMSSPDAMMELRAMFPARRRAAAFGEDAALRELHRDIARFEGKVP